LKWLELSVEAPPEFVEPLSAVFYRYGCGGVAVESPGGYSPDEGEAPPDIGRVTVKTYLPLDADTKERRSRIDLGVRLVAHVAPVSPLRERVLAEREWRDAWKQYFNVLHVGKRVVVVPTWREYEAKRTDVVIELDPGMAFGTGHHPTTRMCIELLEQMVRPGMDVLDLGCGSAILSIAAAKLGARSVLGLETDPDSVRAAEVNVRRNGVARTVRIVGESLPRPDIPSNSYDIGVANISAKVISELAGELAAVVRPRGAVVASGILVVNSDSVKQQLVASGCAIERTIVDGDWVALVARR
jgi:ribosomal protein L11 methyltransferase